MATKVQEGRKWAQSNHVQLSSPIEGRVVQPDNAVHLVNLQTGTCSYRRYQANGIPCGHAMACIFAQGLTLETFLPPALSTATWAAMYMTPIPPVDTTDLVVRDDEECNPPVTRVPRGRPKKERYRKEETRAPRGLGKEGMKADDDVAPQERLLHRCGTCGEKGHNARTCHRPH